MVLYCWMVVFSLSLLSWRWCVCMVSIFLYVVVFIWFVLYRIISGLLLVLNRSCDIVVGGRLFILVRRMLSLVVWFVCVNKVIVLLIFILLLIIFLMRVLDCLCVLLIFWVCVVILMVVCLVINCISVLLVFNVLIWFMSFFVSMGSKICFVFLGRLVWLIRVVWMVWLFCVLKINFMKLLLVNCVLVFLVILVRIVWLLWLISMVVMFLLMVGWLVIVFRWFIDVVVVILMRLLEDRIGDFFRMGFVIVKLFFVKLIIRLCGVLFLW